MTVMQKKPSIKSLYAQLFSIWFPPFVAMTCGCAYKDQITMKLKMSVAYRDKKYILTYIYGSYTWHSFLIWFLRLLCYIQQLMAVTLEFS